MKVLIFADNLGNNAPGFVFHNLVRGLSQKIEFDVVTATPGMGVDIKGQQFFVKPIRRWPSKIIKSIFILFGVHITQYLWAKRSQKYIREKDYDVVISLMSYSFYASLMAANMYCSVHNAKHICYCVDAVPAPSPWEKDGIFKKAIKRFVQSNFKRVNLLAMTNKEMLAYELSIIASKHIDGMVVPNPPLYSHLISLEDEVDMPSFVYAGKIYGLREPDALVSGFDLFLEKYPTSKLYIVGSNMNKDDFQKMGCANIDNYVFVDYTRDLIPIFNKCVGLIDINANIDNDVFLSSKILSYLPYNRLIISESGANSPVRSMFASSSTILHIKHNPNEYFNAFEYCYKNYTSIDFSEREEYLARFNMDAVADLLISKFVI